MKDVDVKNSFDENWYLASNPDVKRGLLNGSIESPLKHYLDHGQAEGRLGKPLERSYKRVFTYGAYGSNNVGDEAILEGVRVFYPECIQIHILKPRNGQGIEYNNIIADKKFFHPEDYLIIGGGGLMYNKNTVNLMKSYARQAADAGATVDILRVGCEAAHESYYQDISELFDSVRFASVRSSTSRQIIKSITGKDCVYQRDFAFELAPRIGGAIGAQSDIPVIGIVIATIDNDSLLKLARVIKRYINKSSSKKARFVFIPHSRSYFDVTNNDCITSEILWSSVANPSQGDDELFSIAPFSADPETVLTLYRHLDAVMSLRYHGLVFSSIVGIPALALGGKQIKIRSFIEDNMSKSLFVSEDVDDLSTEFDRFYEYVIGHKERRRTYIASATY